MPTEEPTEGPTIGCDCPTNCAGEEVDKWWIRGIYREGGGKGGRCVGGWLCGWVRIRRGR